MNVLYIVVSILLAATVNSKSTSANPNDPFGYYDEFEDNNTIQNDNTGEPSTQRPSFKTQPRTINAKLGDQVVLDCQTENAESYTISWKMNDAQVALGTLFDATTYNFLPNNSLIIKRVKPQSSARYSCVILIDKGDSISLTHRLKVENAAEVTSLSTDNSKSNKYNTGDNFTITCKVSGKPMPTIKWYFKGKDQDTGLALQSSNDASPKEGSDTLRFESATMQNSGTYRCEANNGESMDDLSIHIDVFDKPVVIVNKIYTKKTITGLECLVNANPTANVSWLRDNENLRPNANLYKTKKSLKILFNNIDEADFGVYTCVAENEMGSSKKSVVYQRPMQPQFKEFITSKDNIEEATITWTILSHGPISHCVVYYTTNNINYKRDNLSDITYVADAHIMTTESGSYVVYHKPSLPYDGTFEFRARCKSQMGWSELSQGKTFGVKGFRGKDEDSQVGAGSVHLVPSIAVFITAFALINQ